MLYSHVTVYLQRVCIVPRSQHQAGRTDCSAQAETGTADFIPVLLNDEL